MELFRKCFVSCHILQCWWNNDMFYFSWCSQNSASGVFFLGFFQFSQAVTAKTDWQGRKYDGIVLYSNVGYEDVDHGVQGRHKEVKGVRKWKLIKPERSLHVPNYATFSVCFLLYFNNGSYTVAICIFPKSGVIKSYQYCYAYFFPPSLTDGLF